ncbi:MAG: hypothetical protein GEU87_10005 [Alphaproteobacteria bacterium]|nr:hypothetical protein [Alphaproteobacteria bacterium]
MLEGLKVRLMAPALVQAFIDEYHAEINRAARDTEHAQRRLRRERADIERKIESILRAVEDGFYNASLKDRLSGLERRRDEIDRVLAEDTTPAVRLHPGLGRIYRDRVARLETALTAEDTAAEAGDILRLLIDRVELRPRDREGGLDIMLFGDLAAILSLCEAAEHKDELPGRDLPGSQLSVAAGAEFEPAPSGYEVYSNSNQAARATPSKRSFNATTCSKRSVRTVSRKASHYPRIRSFTPQAPLAASLPDGDAA